MLYYRFCLFDWSGNFCHDTKGDRERVAKELANELSSAAGSGTLSVTDAETKAKACLVDTCGGCVGKGINRSFACNEFL